MEDTWRIYNPRRGSKDRIAYKVPAKTPDISRELGTLLRKSRNTIQESLGRAAMLSDVVDLLVDSTQEEIERLCGTRGAEPTAEVIRELGALMKTEGPNLPVSIYTNVSYSILDKR